MSDALAYIQQLEAIDAEPVVRCKDCECASPDLLRREDVLFCDEWERFTTRRGYCHKAFKKMDLEVQDE